jgi:glycosyltransferase involved in cell wall biosynthesis
MNDVNEQTRVAPETAAASGPAILQILPRLEQGGTGRGAVDLARHLIERGWHALVASNGGSAEAELTRCGGRSFRLPAHSTNPLVMRANIRRLQRVIRERGVRLVHAHARAPAWSACYAARRCNVPFVTTVHGLYRGGRGPLKKRFNAIMARGDRVIALSDYVAEHIRRHYGVPEERLRVIRRGIDTRRFDPDAVDRQRVDALAEQWRVPPEAKVILVPARVIRDQGHRILLEAVARLPRRRFLCLILEGPDGRAGEIDGLIGSLELGSVARVAGSCDDLPAALMLADVVAVPTSAASDPLGRLSVQAQAMGKPVIVTDLGGLGETLMPAATGWLVEPGDADALAHALELALAMPDEARARLAVRARRFVTRSFSLERMGDATMKVYRELLDGLPPDVNEGPLR